MLRIPWYSLITSTNSPTITYGRPFVSKLSWHDIPEVFSHAYLQSFLLHDIRAFFCHVYFVLSCFVGFLFPNMTIFLQTRILMRIFMRTKKSIYLRYKQACGIWGHRKSLYKSHRIIPSVKPLHVRWSWNVTSVWIKHGHNFEQGLVLIHCPHSTGGRRLPDNGFVGIRGLSLERLCTLFHKCWPKQRSIQLEISVRQAKHHL